MAQSRKSQAALSPETALQALVDGNARFCAGERSPLDIAGGIEATSGGQWPFAAILGCIDSRVPPETVFDQGLGDLFSARIAGNFVNDDILGSLEFACAVAGSKVIVVLGHTSCGAVKGAVSQAKLGHLTGMLEKLEPAIQSVGPRPADLEPDYVQAVADQNVDLTVAAIRSRSEVLRGLEEDGNLKIVGAMYDVTTGRVDFR